MRSRRPPRTRSPRTWPDAGGTDGAGRTRRGHDTDRGDAHEREHLAPGEDAADQAVVVVVIDGWGGGRLEGLERHRKDLEWAVVAADPRLAV